MRGFVKIDRSLFSSEMWRERRVFSKAEAWLDIMQRAAYKGKGAFAVGEVKLTERKTAAAWGWEKTAVRRFLAKLVDMGLMERTDRTSIFIVHQLCTKNRTTICTTESVDNQHENGNSAPLNAPKSAPPHLLLYNKKDINKKGGVRLTHTPTPGDEEISDSQWNKFDEWKWQNIPYMAEKIGRQMYAEMLRLAHAAGKDTRHIAETLTAIYYKRRDEDIMTAYKEIIDDEQKTGT